MPLLTLHPRSDSTDLWQKGHVLGFEFAAKVQDAPSWNGIGGGKVIKLSLRDRRNRIVVSFDRGWDEKPKAYHLLRRLAVRQVVARFN